MKVFFLRRETSYGPFFSSRDKVREYLEAEDELSPEEIEQVLDRRNSYEGMEEVELYDGDSRNIFDG